MLSEKAEYNFYMYSVISALCKEKLGELYDSSLF